MNSSVIGIVFDETKENVLLVKRRDVAIWVLPGGGIDPDETPEQAVIREMQEETGLNIAISRLIGIYTPINKLAKTTYVFECIPVSGALQQSKETAAVTFFPIAALPAPFFFIHEDWIKDARLRLPETLHKSLTQVTYFNTLKYFLSHPIQVIRFIFSRLGIPINKSSNR